LPGKVDRRGERYHEWEGQQGKKKNSIRKGGTKRFSYERRGQLPKSEWSKLIGRRSGGGDPETEER